ncbi:MAG: HD domain-containing protein [Sulfurifustaceae bacterium]
MSFVGSLDWAETTRGRLRIRDRWRLVAQALAIRLQRHFASEGETNLAAKLDVNAIRWPDSPAASRAFEQCLELSAPYLFNHSARTYLWAALLAMARGTRHDEEVLFVAAMLHDIGLTEKARHEHKDCACFAVKGAFMARDMLRNSGWSTERIETVAQAIALHLNIRVPPAYGPEAVLLHAGAGCDVIGAGIRIISTDARAWVLARYPRPKFKSNWADFMAHEASLHPKTRIAFLFGLGFRDMILRAPFKE